MHRILTVVTIVLIFGHCLTFQGQTSKKKKPTPDDAFNALRTTAQEAVNSDSAILKRPAFTFNEDEKLLEYYLGGVRVRSFELALDDPYLVPIEREFHIQLLRKLFNDKAAGENFWVPALDRADQLVVEMIRDIQNTPNKKKLRIKLDQRVEQFDETFGTLHQSIRQFAQSKGYTAKKVGDRGLASESFPVPVIKEPANGTVRVLPLTKYVMCRDLNLCGNKWPWRELVSEVENLIGEYYYEADWGGGRKNDGTFDVRNAAPRIFRPRP
jgi:hypothetical protein